MMGHVTRRTLLTAMAGAGASLAFANPLMAMGSPASRSVAFSHLHTGEKLSVTYWEKGLIIPDALKEINQVLRDHRTNDIADMDTELLIQLTDLHAAVGGNQPFEVISAYRSPKTNAMLAAKSGGVAKKSKHMLGKAIDIRLPGIELSNLRKAALAMKRGGVGYYPSSNFVHVDTGRVRQWT